MSETKGVAGWKQRFSGHALPILLALGACATVFSTLDDYGITWDESTYCTAATYHAAWFWRGTQPFFKQHPQAKIDDFWWPTHDHPPMGTLAAGFLRHLLTFRLHWVRSLRACRLQTLIFVFLAVYALFSLVREAYGAGVAALAAVSFLLLPRAFSDAHLLALDYPTTSLWVMSAWLFWKGLNRVRWIIAAGFAIGLTMLTKINGFFLFVLVLLCFAVRYRRELLDVFRGGGSVLRRRHVLLGLLALAVIPPVLFVLCWPWLWPAPLDRLREYLRGQSAHFSVATFYLGATGVVPPWHYPFVMTAITVPLVTLIPLLVGICMVGAGAKRNFNFFILANACVPLLAVAFLTKSRYDGVRLFLQAFPFLCALAAIGVFWIFRLAQRWGASIHFACLYAALFAASTWLSTISYHPYQSSYYNAIIGGAKGAERYFEMDYWGGAFGEVVPFVRKHPDKRFWVPIGLDALNGYKHFGFLSPSAQVSTSRDADYLLLLIRQGYFNDELWHYYRTEQPVYSVTVRGAHLLNVYEIPR